MARLMHELIDDFMEYLLIEKMAAKNTLMAYNKDVLQYCDFLENELKVTDFNTVKKSDVNQFLAGLYDQSFASSTIARKLTTIKVLHRFLFITEVVRENVCQEIVGPKLADTIPEVLSISEVDLLLGSFNVKTPTGYRNKTMVELMYSSGLRVSELVALKIEDIHLKMNFVRCLGKGNEERIIPIGGQAVDMLHYYIDEVRPQLNKHYDTQNLFLSINGNRLNRQDFWLILKKHVKISNMRETISPHKLRHTFATHLLENDTDIRYIQELLGHKDIKTTQVYTHVDSKNLSAVVSRYHPRNKKGK